jgi:flagellar FliL protein
MSETPSDAKAKGSKKLIPIVAAVVLLAAGGGGYFWYANRAAEAAAEAEPDDEDDDEVEAEDHGERAEADHDEGGKSTPRKKKTKKRKGQEAHTTLMSFEPFVVNLADANAARFLRTNVQLVVVPGEDEAAGGGGGHGGGAPGPSVPMMRARSAILELLSAQTSDELTTPQGKARLKREIIERIEDVLEETKVEDVLFTDFVIQF